MPEQEVFPRGTRVVKINSEPRDGHQDGSPATVIERVGPVRDPLTGHLMMGYFVHWDDLPEVPVFIACHRVRRIDA